MKKIRLYIYLSILSSITLISWFFSIVSISVYAWGNPNYDLLQQAFEAARNNDYVVGKWNTPVTVGWEIFNNTWAIGGKDGSSLEEPYIIRITKLIIRITVALSVSIVIIWGIMYIVAFGDEGKQKKARNVIIYALIWVLIALSALAVVQLTTTITKNSLWPISYIYKKMLYC